MTNANGLWRFDQLMGQIPAGVQRHLPISAGALMDSHWPLLDVPPNSLGTGHSATSKQGLPSLGFSASSLCRLSYNLPRYNIFD